MPHAHRRLTVLAAVFVVYAFMGSAARASTPDLNYRLWTREDGLPQGSVRAIAQTPDGYLWIATLDGLVRFDGVRMVVFAKPDAPAMTSNRCLTMFVDRRGALWVGTDDGGIVQVSGTRMRAFGRKDGVIFSTFNGLIEDSEGTIWATAVTGGPAVFDGTRWTPTSRKMPVASTAFPGGLTIPSTPAGHPSRPQAQMLWTQTPSGRIWVLSDGYVHRYETGSWTTFSTPVPADVLPAALLFEDREGTLWIGSEGRGLLQAMPTAVRALVPPPRWRNVNTLAEDGSGRMWLGTDGGPLFLEHGAFTSVPPSSWWPRAPVTAFEPDADGTILAGGPNGLYRVWPGRGFEVIHPAPHSHVSDFLRDRRGTLWVATGVGLLRSSSASWTVVEGLPFQDVKVLREARDGALWVGAYGGLARIAGDHQRAWTTATGLSSDRIRALHEDANGALWIGTYDGGLMRFADGRFVTILKRHGLFDNGAFTILDGGDGRYYMCSNRGIYSVPIRELEAFATGAAREVRSRAFRSAEGMPSSECNGGTQPSGWRRADGSLWFPTQGGVAVLDPSAVPYNAVPPQVVVEEITTERRALAASDAIELVPGERRLEVRYTANTFVRPEGTRFRHRLDNFDREWVEAAGQRFVQYSYIPPGRYTLTIVAANSDGVWSPKGVSLTIRVLPYWWETAWFRAAAVLLGFALLGAAFQRRITALNRRRAEQDVFARRLLESQESERKRIAHELHDGIGQTLVVIKNRALLGIDEGGDPALITHLHEISSAAGGAIDEVRKVAYGLRPYQLDRLGVKRALESLVEQSASASGVALTADIGDVDGVLPRSDEVNVYRIVQEAVSNMIRHAGAKTGRVSLTVDAREIHIRVEDDGSGFDPAAGGGRLGLAGMTERARILGGRVDVRSSPGHGTTVAVTVPRDERP